MRCSCSVLGRCCALVAVLVLCASAFGDLQPRRIAPKVRQTVVKPTWHYPDVIIVKFNDDLPVSVSNGQIDDKGTGVLDAARAALGRLPGVTWEPMHKLPEARLDELRATAEGSLRREIADLTTFFYVKVPSGVDAGTACDVLNALDVVENAWPAPLPAPSPVAPDFEAQQFYLDPATDGVDTDCMWLVPGGTGAHVAICDLEYSWNLDHLDLPTVTLLGAAPTDPFGDDNHGTAVLGEMAGLRDGMGVTGITYDSTFYVAAANTGGNYDLAGAISTAMHCAWGACFARRPASWIEARSSSGSMRGRRCSVSATR